MARLLPWLIFGPFLVVAGAILGRSYPEIVGRDQPRVWSEPPMSHGVEGADPVRLLPSLSPLLDEVRPGVVAITTLLKRNKPADTNPPSPANSRIQAPTEDLSGFGIVRGTGFVVHGDGLIITSHHVVADYASIRVDLSDRRTFQAKVVGEDPISDLALLQLEPGTSGLNPKERVTGLKVLNLGDSSEVRQGDWVMSLGNPYEFHGSLSVGLITFVGRHLTEEGVHVTNEYLQFSAPVNPGESGAPLFDMGGNIIGVTRRTLTEGRGISFAVPSRIVKQLLSAVERGDRQVQRGYVGMEFRAPSRPEELRGLVVEGGGAEVTRVIKGHPADSAGVQVGDVILSFNRDPVADAADLYELITVTRPGEDKPVSVLRAGEVLPPLTVRVGEVGKSTMD
jgi:serine protease Do